MSTPSSASCRLGFIDQLRGWAVIVMIEVHTFNEWLHPDIKAQTLWKVITFINGLVAPSFIMLAGFSLGIAASRKWTQYARPNGSLLPRFRHLALIFAVGYLLHLPSRTYSYMVRHPDPLKINKFWAMDVLQLIVVGLVIMHLLLFVVRRRTVFMRVALLLGALVFLATPWAFHTDVFEALPYVIATWFNKAHGSLFPLFPWSGFVFLGTGLGLWYTSWLEKGKGDLFIRSLGIAGAVLIVLAVAADRTPFTLQHPYEFWRTSPEFNVIRLGCVLLLLSFLRLLEVRRGVNPTAVRLMGQESFLVYAVHLVLLYGVFFGTSLAELFRGQFNYLQSAVPTIALIVLMMLVAWLWQRLKAHSMLAARLTMGGVFTVAALLFFFIL